MAAILAISCLHPGLASPDPYSPFDEQFFKAMQADYG